MFFVQSQVWNKEKILSPHEDWNLRPLDSALNWYSVYIYIYMNLTIDLAHGRVSMAQW